MNRITKSRMLKESIIEILQELQTPLTADDIYIQIIEKKIKTSISTIYAQLHKLVHSHVLSVDTRLRASRYYYRAQFCNLSFD